MKKQIFTLLLAIGLCYSAQIPAQSQRSDIYTSYSLSLHKAQPTDLYARSWLGASWDMLPETSTALKKTKEQLAKLFEKKFGIRPDSKELEADFPKYLSLKQLCETNEQDLAKQLNALQDHLSSCQSEHGSCADQSTALREQVSNLQGELNTCQEQHGTCKDQQDTLKRTVAKHETNLSQCNSDLTDTVNQLNQCAADRDSHSQTAGACKEHSTQLAKELADCQEKIKIMDQLKDGRAQLAELIKRFKEVNTLTNEKYEVFKEERQTESPSWDASKQELAELYSQALSLQKQLNAAFENWFGIDANLVIENQDSIHVDICASGLAPEPEFCK